MRKCFLGSAAILGWPGFDAATGLLMSRISAGFASPGHSDL
jgi:hypothetical protein